MATISTSEARAALPELISRVQRGEEITITRHGQPAAVLVRPDALRSRRASEVIEAADQVRQMLEEAGAATLPPPAGLDADRAEELIAHVSEGRQGR